MQFAQSQKMQAVGQLAGGVAHDFNNLLTAIIGFSDLLLLRYRPGDPVLRRHHADQAERQPRRRPGAPAARLLAPADPAAARARAHRRAGASCRICCAACSARISSSRSCTAAICGLVKVDQGQLEQVIINLAVNARDAMPNGGTLTDPHRQCHRAREPCARGHEIMPPGEYVLIEVADTGTGIPQGESRQDLRAVLHHQGGRARAPGLGLSTVYGIVKQTGGFIFVDSEIGKGTRSAIFLPRHPAASEAGAAARRSAGERRRRATSPAPARVLLVEDEDAVRSFRARARCATAATTCSRPSAARRRSRCHRGTRRRSIS